MHYLDWGGTGDVLLLLTGFGDNAHAFDDFAPRFTDRFRVIALTRRGFGETERPKTGYELATRVEDIRSFLDALKIDRANVVGHSLAGDEMTLLATRYPLRVIKMVYLDAAYDRSKAFDCAMNPPGGMPPMFKRLLMEALNCPGAAEVTVTDMPPPDVYNVFVSTMRSSSAFHPDYTRVRVPALAIYSDIEKPEMLMPLDEETSKKFAAWWKTEQVPKSRASIEQFRKEMKGGQVIEIKDAEHYLFRGKTADEVYRLTRAFLLN
jgi:non-heme chloroperoxidase